LGDVVDLKMFQVGFVEYLKDGHEVQQLLGRKGFAIFHFEQYIGALVKESA